MICPVKIAGGLSGFCIGGVYVAGGSDGACFGRDQFASRGTLELCRSGRASWVQRVPFPAFAGHFRVARGGRADRPSPRAGKRPRSRRGRVGGGDVPYPLVRTLDRALPRTDRRFADSERKASLALSRATSTAVGHRRSERNIWRRTIPGILPASTTPSTYP